MKLSQINAVLHILSKSMKPLNKYEVTKALEDYLIYTTSKVIGVVLSQARGEGLTYSEKDMCNCCLRPTSSYGLTDQGRIKASRARYTVEEHLKYVSTILN